MCKSGKKFKNRIVRAIKTNTPGILKMPGPRKNVISASATL
jgi:hypothetical protein